MPCQSDFHFDAQLYLLMLLVHSMHSTELQLCITFVMLCPIFAAYIINTYRQPVRLFIVDGKEIASAEHHKEIRWPFR